MAHRHECVACGERRDDLIVITAQPERVNNVLTILICPTCLRDDVNAKVVALAILERFTQ